MSRSYESCDCNKGIYIDADTNESHECSLCDYWLDGHLNESSEWSEVEDDSDDEASQFLKRNGYN